MATVDYLTSAGDGATLTTYTFSSQSLGVAADDRVIAIQAGSSNTGTGGLTSVTVGGVSATLIAEEATGNPADATSMWYAEVPTGTTGDVVVVCKSLAARCGIALWRLTGVTPTPHDSGQDDGTLGSNPSASTTIAVESGGIIIASAYTSNSGTTNPPTFAWTGVTEEYETVAESKALVSGGSDDSGTVEAGKTITVDVTSDNTRVAMVVASWSPPLPDPTTQIKGSTLETNLVSYWDLEEASGTRYDLHGSNDLTDNNTVGQATGKQGNAADFESTNSEYLSITDAAQSGLDLTTAYSTSFWVKFESLSGHMMFFDKYYNDAGGGGFGLFWLTTNTLYLRHAQASGLDDHSESWTPSTGTWYHIAVTFSSTNGSKIYIDGTSLGTDATHTAPTANSMPFELGRRNREETYFDMYFDGTIDEFGFWSKALTSTEVSALYNSGNGLPYYAPADIKNDTDLSTNLVSYYELEDVTDSTATGNDLTNGGSATFATAKQGNGVDLNGSSQYLNSSTLWDADNQSTTFTGWFKSDDYTQSEQTIFSSGSGTSDDTGFSFLLNNNTTTDGSLYLLRHGVAWHDTGVNVGDNNWHHYTVAMNSSGHPTLYLDGVQIYTLATAFPTPLGGCSLGEEWGGGSATRFFNGLQDEFGVWSETLSVAQVRGLYGYGTPPVYEAAVVGGATDNALAFCNF